MPATPQVIAAGTLADLFGNALTKGTLVFTLCGYGSAIPRVSGSALLAETAPRKVAVNGSGQFAINIWGNDVITPAGTFYTVQILDSNGNIIQTNAYQFAGAGSVDLSAAAPYNPPPAAIIPPNPVLLNPAGVQVIAGGITIQGNLIVTGTLTNGGIVPVAFSATPAFNAALGNVFDMTLTGNVTSSTIAGTFGGQLITFILIQDAVGGRTFVWPPTVKDAGAIDATPNAICVQSFVARANGNLYPIGPMTIN